jgi:hypothetical protein
VSFFASVDDCRPKSDRANAFRVHCGVRFPAPVAADFYKVAARTNFGIAEVSAVDGEVFTLAYNADWIRVASGFEDTACLPHGKGDVELLGFRVHLVLLGYLVINGWLGVW